ncbi:glutamyl-tRNA reductase [Flocculibacter collagenilyticus]|uniref:glutamyl-tRNA reductase n=1 Tax=Flocculibacter collagenilyticus TaxID=2744479 RepID=UPI0018F4B9AC|nr:glutamyl-tRNA reductase [Flocculibacter collagenilyticus]
MTILALGINHKTAPVALREKVAFAPELMTEALSNLAKQTAINEAVIVSTCNRTELYCNSSEKNYEPLIEWLANFHHVDKQELASHTYCYQDTDAISHLMRVACGLDSLVLGEPQILGQIKQSFRQAKAADTVSMLFEKLFQKTFSVAKLVRTETDIGASAVSVAFASVNLAKHIFGSLTPVKVLLVGAGETIELVAKHLTEQGASNITVANRTIARAESLAKLFDATVISLGQVPEVLAEADVVISSTASTLPIIGKGMVEQAIKKRKYKPMFFVDLAVPRDIEGQVSEIDEAFLYTVDDLQSIVAQNVASREKAAEEAEQIVQNKSEEFDRWTKSLNSIDIIKDYRQQCDQIKLELVERASNQLASGVDVDVVIVELANKLTNRLMHAPTTAIKDAAQNGAVDKLTVLKSILGIEK